MRRILIVSLLLTPMLFALPAVADQPGNDAEASTRNLRVSTGVAAPDLVYSTSVDALPSDLAFPLNARVVLSFNVDEQGNPTDFQVLNPSNPILDEHVIHAVSRFRFLPATLDNDPLPIDMTWVVQVDK
jgi:TonB family protein